MKKYHSANSFILNSRSDPLKVRKTTEEVIRNLKFVSINQRRLEPVAKILRRRIRSERLLTESQFGRIRISPQRIFILDAVNFCFWSKREEPKWEVEYPTGTFNNGWYALTASFDRALEEGIPVLDAHYLETITDKDTKRIFRGRNQTRIPLLNKRTAILREIGSILTKNFSGNIETLLKDADYDAAIIAKSIIDNFPSFNDTSILEGIKVHFFKRAQIFAHDLSLLRNANIANIESLTAFADYKLPQILRSLGVLRYNQSLAKKVNSLKLIPKDSREEIEMRASTIWACERLASLLKVSPATVDNVLWNLSQETKKRMKPYHRTLTTCY